MWLLPSGLIAAGTRAVPPSQIVVGLGAKPLPSRDSWLGAGGPHAFLACGSCLRGRLPQAHGLCLRVRFHRYARQDFLLDHAQTLFRNMSDWSTDELRRSPEHLTPYLGLLRRTGYGTLHVENLLRLISYWASVVGVMEGMMDELVVVHVVQWEALNSHFELVELNCTIAIMECQLTEAWEALRRLRVRERRALMGTRGVQGYCSNFLGIFSAPILVFFGGAFLDPGSRGVVVDTVRNCLPGPQVWYQSPLFNKDFTVAAFRYRHSSRDAVQGVSLGIQTSC
ncbi:hypothetical protein MRB53_010254 [Persea americana]|uniref:Uncharacterized protein n=1 Tax=Persea americana TaxID=3435 RepID=A0ACC2LSB4_PERAE|nr:hypothetical protein MRB53_010254 [Persea americana]